MLLTFDAPCEFQSTLSVRRATSPILALFRSSKISIHALREESDKALPLLTAMKVGFQSTLSVRRATRSASKSNAVFIISIHALREESDRKINAARRKINISIHALREESD